MAKNRPSKGPIVGRQRRAKAKRGHDKKQTLVFDQNERIDFVKGFEKRKQERRDRAKQEALVKEKEIRKLLRQKRKEALNRLPQMHQQQQGHGDQGGLEEQEQSTSMLPTTTTPPPLSTPPGGRGQEQT